MDKDKRRCFRCRGQKKMYKMASAYSLVDTGGIEVTCPLCNGDGVIDKIEVIEKKADKKRKERRNEAQTSAL